MGRTLGPLLARPILFMKDWDTDPQSDRWLWLEATAIGAMVIYLYVSLVHDGVRRLIGWIWAP